MRLQLGSAVHGTDGECGELADLVIDPHTRRVTHLVVQPRGSTVRLVPVALVAPGDDALRLTCTTAAFHDLDAVREVAFLRLDQYPVDDPDWDVGIVDVLALPYYQADSLGGALGPEGDTELTYDRIPKGDVEIRRQSEVLSSDGHGLGHVEGFVVDDDEGITHLLLQRGHLWGKREVTIPVGAVDEVRTDEVTLKLTKDEVSELPALKVRRHGAA